MNKYLIVFLLFSTVLCLFPTGAESSESIKVGFGKNIMPNGKFAEFEWNDAAVISANGNFDILIKQDNTYLYFAIEFKDVMYTGLDLYLAESSLSRKMLHVSSALGERDFQNGNWLDSVWGENYLWMANPVGLVKQSNGEQGILELEGFEFQIDKSIFQTDFWYFLIHLKRPEQTYPSDANPKNIDTWQTMKL